MRRAVLIVAALIPLLFASPASAAPLGTLTLSAATGSASQSPMLASVTTSAACPAGYGTNAAIKVGRNGQFSNLNIIASAGNYDAAPFTLATNRSLAKALTGNDMGTVADGAYEIVVLCAGEILGDHPERFSIAITVSGGTWQTGGAPSPPAPGTNGEVNIVATVAAGQSPGQGPLPRTGASIAAYAGLGLLLVGVGIAAVRFFRKQYS